MRHPRVAQDVPLRVRDQAPFEVSAQGAGRDEGTVYAAVVEKMVEIRYAGVTVAKATAIRELDTRGVFLGLTEPLPTGTDVVLRVGGEDVPGRVATVVESADVAKAGMKVAFRVAGKANLFGEPTQAGDPVQVDRAATAPAAPVTESAPPAMALSADGEVAAASPGSDSTGTEAVSRAAGDASTAPPVSAATAAERPAGTNPEPETSKKNKKSKRR
jgi:hypothetical protein